MSTATNSRFHELLEARGVLVADGAMGTSLFALGMESGACPEFLNVDDPEMIRTVHRQFVEAGSDIILTNTFGGNRRRLMLHKATDRVAELNKAGVTIAREVADNADRPVLVAGSVGPTGDLFEPLGPLTHAEGVEVFSEQIEAMVEAGADLAWAETLSSVEEISAAYEAAAKFDLPLVVTMSFDTHGKTMMGFKPSELGQWADENHAPLAAVGANCGIGPGDVVAAVHELADACHRPVVAKANCGIPVYEDGQLTYPSDPDEMTHYVDLALRSGAKIIGACCGSTGEHLGLIRQHVDAFLADTAPAERPEVTEIHARLGNTATGSAGSTDAADAAPKRRRRRRAS
ncbi:MAG: betaine--homocysteine S-methyltransferase [Acidimicrobiales bacterium]|nr:betaine--homocysteine S-methyltransferase [Acidimicrobiales bacterium]